METSEKLGKLKLIRREDKFREGLLISLLYKMQLAPVSTHRTDERRKDIVCHEINAFAIREWLAVVAKIWRTTGFTSGAGGVATLVNQIGECFDYPYKDPLSKSVQSICKVFVMTNDKIIHTAREKIAEEVFMAHSKIYRLFIFQLLL